MLSISLVYRELIFLVILSTRSAGRWMPLVGCVNASLRDPLVLLLGMHGANHRLNILPVAIRFDLFQFAKNSLRLLEVVYPDIRHSKAVVIPKFCEEGRIGIRDAPALFYSLTDSSLNIIVHRRSYLQGRETKIVINSYSYISQINIWNNKFIITF